MSTLWLPLLLAMPWLGIGAVVLLRRRRTADIARATLIALVLPLILAVALTVRFVPPGLDWPAAGGIAPGLALHLDAVTLPFVLNLLLVGSAAVWYGWGYWATVDRPAVCYSLLLVYVGGMLGVLLADDILLFFTFWEAMLIASSLLLLGWGTGERRGRITLTYFLFSQAGSLLVLAAACWLAHETGHSRLTAMVPAAHGLAASTQRWLALVLLVGFGVKLAVVPLHTWLPDAHAVAPMPVTVLLAGAMLSLGAYGLVRFPIMLFGIEPLVAMRTPLLVLALVMQIYGALLCVASHDIKRLVAYSSVSQMGYVLYGIATFTPQGMAGGIIHILSHGLLKAALFMGVGMAMQATGERDIERVGGLQNTAPAIAASIALAATGMAGVPPFASFHSEWMILSGSMLAGPSLLTYASLFTPLITLGYALWLIVHILRDRPEEARLTPVASPMLHASAAVIVLALALGLAPKLLYTWSQWLTALLGSF